jgi:hypothetical protein
VRRSRAATAAVIVTAFALGFVANGLRSRPSGAERQAPPAPGRHDASRGGSAGQVQDDHARSEGGARAAAVAYATASQGWLHLADEDIDRSVRAVATEAAGPSLSRETVAELREAREALARSPGRVWWLVRPLASRVERFEATTARVVVWTVTVLSAADVALPQADWARVAVDLVWVDAGWRVQAVADTPGPTPAGGSRDRPWQAEPFDRALDGFVRAGAEAAR